MAVPVVAVIVGLTPDEQTVCLLWVQLQSKEAVGCMNRMVYLHATYADSLRLLEIKTLKSTITI